MAHHRFFIDRVLQPPPEVDDEIDVPLSSSDLHHALRTARLQSGETIVVVDPERTQWSCDVVSVSQRGLVASVRGRRTDPAGPDVALYAGLTKGHKMDLTVEKCVEVGVARVVPVLCERSIVRLSTEKAEERAHRWQRVAASAAAQSQRSFVPPVELPSRLDDVLDRIEEYAAVLVAWEESQGRSVADALDGVAPHDPVAVLVGPEGGLTSGEVDLLSGAGAQVVGLGSNILRSETAGIVLTALTVYEMGGLGGRSRG
jgi:16S rRNA (uracil1498-N3)-methyltransferase